LVRDHGLGGGVRGGQAITEILVLTRRLDQSVTAAGRQCCRVSRGGGCAGPLDLGREIG
jgi:hypothetical protein